MNFKLDKNTKVIYREESISLKNSERGSEIEIPLDFKGIIEKIISGEQIINIISDFQKKYSLDYFLAKKQINLLLYALLHQNLINYDSDCTVENKHVNVISALIEITDNCNFRCPHCYVNKTCKNTLRYEDVKNISLELQELKCNRIALTGGEIFTNKDFIKIYTFLYDSGFIVSINTNLSLLNDDIVELFIERPPYEIEVSLYGYDDNSYNDFTRTNNYFNLVLKNLKKLNELGLDITLKNIITKDNKKYFCKIEELAKNLNIKFKSDYISFPKVCDKFGENSQQISPIDTIKHLKNHSGVEKYFLNLYSKPKKQDNFLFKCKSNDDALFINSKKEVSMCVCMQSKSYPYIKGELKNIILKLQTIKEIEYTKFTKCKYCKYISLCRYCPGKFYMATGDYENPPTWFCEFGELAYQTFIQGRKIIRKSYLNDYELEQAFNIIKSNMIKLGFNVTDKDKIIWCNNVKKLLESDDFYFYLVYLNGEIVGFSTVVKENNSFILSEVQLADKVKQTRIILEIIEYLLKAPELKDENKIYFSILKNNDMSNKTFSHLGGQIVSENERKYKYVIQRKSVENYINKLNNRELKS